MANRKTIRGTVLACALFLSVIASSNAVGVGDFNGVVDSSVTLESLSRGVTENHAVPQGGRLVMLVGVAASVDIVGRDKNNFSAEINLVSGQWQGLDAVNLYRCIVTLHGADYAARIPTNPNAPASPDAIIANGQLLVVGAVTGIRQQQDGTSVPVVEAVYIRPIN